MTKVIVDVRERDEYAIEHVKDSINVPLSCFSSTAPGVLKLIDEREIVFICHSGVRSEQAVNLANSMGYQNEHTYSSYDGGLLAWKKDGNPTLSQSAKSKLPLIRQVHLTVGPLFILFSILAATVSSLWLLAIAVMGVGLSIAGATGFCGMAKILALMPWNKVERGTSPYSKE